MSAITMNNELNELNELNNAEYILLKQKELELKTKIEDCVEKYDHLDISDMSEIRKQYLLIKQEIEKEESKMRIEYWKIYRGAITKLAINNDDIEEFLKNYRINFTGQKSYQDEKLIDILNTSQITQISEMSKYILDRIKEDFEDVEENIEYFQSLREKIIQFL